MEESELTSRFLISASKFLQNIRSKSISNDKNLDTISVALRAGRYNFLELRKDKLYFCTKCHSPWREGRFSMRVRNVKVPRKIKKMINVPPENISQYKKKLMDYYKSKLDNAMVLRCKICQNVVKCFTTKTNEVDNLSNDVLKNNELQSDPKKKKKKRKKDKLAGLNIKNIIPKAVDSVLLSSDVECKENNLKTSAIRAEESAGEYSVPKTSIHLGKDLNSDCCPKNVEIHEIDIGQQDIRQDELLNIKLKKKLSKTKGKVKHRIPLSLKSEKISQDTSRSKDGVTSDISSDGVVKNVNKSIMCSNILNSSKNPSRTEVINRNILKLKKKNLKLKSVKVKKKSNSQLKEFLKAL